MTGLSKQTTQQEQLMKLKDFNLFGRPRGNFAPSLGLRTLPKRQFTFCIIGPPTPLSFEMTPYYYVAVGKGAP